MSFHGELDPETQRLREAAEGRAPWRRWGSYLPERQWGTVREDYSPGGACWDYFPHDHARSRAYRWGEDGLLGLCEDQALLCFAPALWNGRDPILKERLFGLAHAEGNHGEDVKECYFYLDNTPTHSYMRALYRYPQAAFPYAWLLYENRCRGLEAPEFELLDTGLFDEGRFFDLEVEYAKAAPEDLLLRLTVANRGPDAAPLYVLPQLWFRNTWAWGCPREGRWGRPRIERAGPGRLRLEHAALGVFRFDAAPLPDGSPPPFLFTENESNWRRIDGGANPGPFVKDAFHEYVVHRRLDAVNPEGFGTKAAALYAFVLEPGEARVLRLRLCREEAAPAEPFGPEFDRLLEQRRAEADRFYAARFRHLRDEESRRIARQACAGLLWSRKFYYFSVRDWLRGDPLQPPPPPGRSRNREWKHLFNRDIVSVPDTWEYPWYAAWDLAFHALPLARLDPEFAKEQLLLLLRDGYMHPNGQIPAYEFAFSDANPPVHAWAALRVYRIDAALSGRPDRGFLERVFHKLLINFTWWVNRQDIAGHALFAGGFLGLDNIGVFDRGKPLPNGGRLAQADGTAWMGFYCASMLSIALELARQNPVYEEIASRFFEYFVQITDALNTLGGTGLWDEEEGFYCDRILHDHTEVPVRLRSMVGLIPLLAVVVLEREAVERLPAFAARLRWFLAHCEELACHILEGPEGTPAAPAAPDRPLPERMLLSLAGRERLERILRRLFDEGEFLSPCGIRSLSRSYADSPYLLRLDGAVYEVRYDPGESRTTDFGANSNWRGPIWFPLNWLLVEALEHYHAFFGDSLRVECPAGSGVQRTLAEAARLIAERLAGIFRRNREGRAPWHGEDDRFARDPLWRDLLLFHEFFHGDTGRGLGASHQTGWTALVVECLERLAVDSGSDGPPR